MIAVSGALTALGAANEPLTAIMVRHWLATGSGPSWTGFGTPNRSGH